MNLIMMAVAVTLVAGPDGEPFPSLVFQGTANQELCEQWAKMPVSKSAIDDVTGRPALERYRTCVLLDQQSLALWGAEAPEEINGKLHPR